MSFYIILINLNKINNENFYYFIMFKFVWLFICEVYINHVIGLFQPINAEFIIFSTFILIKIYYKFLIKVIINLFYLKILLPTSNVLAPEINKEGS